MSAPAADATTLPTPPAAAPADPAVAAARALLDAGQLPEAEAAFGDLLAARPGDAAVLTGLGDVLTDAARPAEAMAVYRQVIDAAPDAPASSDAYDGLAALLQDAGDVDGAVAASKRSVELTGDPDEVYRLGYLLDQMRRPLDAIAMFDLASRLRPTFAEAHAKVAAHLLATGDTKGSVARYQKAVDGRPDMAELHTNLAFAQHAAAEDDSAIKTIRRAIDLKPDLPEGHNLLGVIFRDRRRPAEALQSFTRAVQLRPDFAEAYHNLGLTLEAVGRVTDATQYFEQAVKLQPKVPRFHENLGRHRLLLGQWPTGWPEFEWRRADPTNPGVQPIPVPLWDGVADLQGKSILLRAERRPTDTVLFAQYAKAIADRGARVVVQCQPELVDLVRTATGVSEVFQQGGAIPATDFQFPMMSVPVAMFELPDTVSPARGFLSGNAGRVSKWADKLPGTGRKVGLVWGPDGADSDDRSKVCPVRQLAALGAVPDVRLIRLQGDNVSRLPDNTSIVDLAADFSDAAELAGLIANLDLVIAVDSLAAHVSAALGKPTWILLEKVPDWRWMLDRLDSPWYPTARLFRQPEVGDWASVTAAVMAALAAG